MFDHIGFRQLVHANQVLIRSFRTATPTLNTLRGATSIQAAPSQAASLPPARVLRVSWLNGAGIGTSQVVQVLNCEHCLFCSLLMLIFFFHYTLNSRLFAIDLWSLTGWGVSAGRTDFADACHAVAALNAATDWDGGWGVVCRCLWLFFDFVQRGGHKWVNLTACTTRLRREKVMLIKRVRLEHFGQRGSHYYLYI